MSAGGPDVARLFRRRRRGAGEIWRRPGRGRSGQAEGAIPAFLHPATNHHPRRRRAPSPTVAGN